MKIIPYGKQIILKKDINHVVKSLNNERVTQGKYIDLFQKKISKLLKVKYSFACSSGTTGLYLAFKGINLKKKDNVIMPAINFVASFNVCKLLDANIYLADVDPLTGQMTPETLMRCIKNNNIKNIKAVVLMYLGGAANDNYEFYKLKKKYDFFIIEDACHALGAKIKSNKKTKYVGSCFYTDICVFSFHPLKSITSGEGGAVVTNNKKFSNTIKLARSHGINYKKNHWEYDVDFSSLNFRISEVNCALVYSQLFSLKKFIDKRKEIANLYKKEFNILKKHIRVCNKNPETAWHLFQIQINFKSLKQKSIFFRFMKSKKIFSQNHYIPIYRFKKIFKKSVNLKDYSGSEFFFKNTVSIPIFFSLKFSQVKYIVFQIDNFVKRYNKQLKYFN